MSTPLVLDADLVRRFDNILARGLCFGTGERGKQVCIEAAICEVLNLPHGDEPECVEPAVRVFKIALNDKKWSSPQARAKGLRDCGLAQLGSRGVVNGRVFVTTLAERTIRVLLPRLFRELGKPGFAEAADRCEREGTREAALFASEVAHAAADAAATAAYAAYAAAHAYAAHADAYADAHAAAYAAAYAADAADAAATATAAHAAHAAHAAATATAAHAAADADAATDSDEYLALSAQLATEILRDLGSPGCALLLQSKEGGVK